MRWLLPAVLALGGSAWSQCVSRAAQFPLAPSAHVALCTEVAYNSNPATSGNHYSQWAAFKTYTAPVPRGFLVHDLEHGAVVVNYRCPEGCASEVAALQAFLDGFPADPGCTAPLRRRFVLAPDTLLPCDARFAAAAWTWNWTSSCLDTASLRAFIDAHYGQAPEDFCIDGIDLSADGWCGSAAPGSCGLAARGILPALAAGRSQVLWRGVLSARGRFQVEVRTLDGALLALLPGGEAGPGPAEAAWDPGAFRARHPGAGPVAVRAYVTDKLLGGRLLARGLALP